jgi:prepilin-type N-terminal cleavage/methylation domain-containing protein
LRSRLDRVIRRAGGQEGFTLPELLMATVLGLLVVGVAATVFTAAVRSQPGLTKRGDAISQARFTMERLTRELRQGTTVYTATPTQLSLTTYVDSATCGGAHSSTAIACRVTYTCATTACTRVEAKPDGTSPGGAVTVVSGLSSGNVFTYWPTIGAARYVRALFIFPGQNGDDAITVSDAAALRNPGAPAS